MPEPLCPEPDPPSPHSPTSSTSSETNEPLYFQTSEAVSSLNKCLAEIGETPYSQSRARAKSYPRQIVKKILKQCNVWLSLENPLTMELRCSNN